MRLLKLKSSTILSIFLLNIFIGCNSNPKKNKTKTGPSLEQKIGQMIVIGFRGNNALEGTKVHELVEKHNIGGVVLYDRDMPSKETQNRNIESNEQLFRLNKQLQEISPTKLIIAIDEEGGFITRLKKEKGFAHHKSHQKIGEINNPDTTRIWAKQMAEELNNLGINMNFGPVVDLNINPECPVIGKRERSFSISPDVVIQHSKIFIEEHKKKKIICVPKHFPGHGSAIMDSHKDLTDVTKTWSEVELLPYKELIKKGLCNVIMTAHVYNAQLDTLPSTLSEKIIKGILKKELNWDGVVISDDMQMGAINKYYGFEESIEKALNAGVDMLLLSNNSYQMGYDSDIAIKTIEFIKSLVQNGKITEERINKSYQKIVELKSNL